MKFVDRKVELAGMREWYSRPVPGLMVLFGRRRVGKTLLLSHWLEASRIPERNVVFWTASSHGSAVQLRDATQKLLEQNPEFSQLVGANYTFPSWEALFTYIADRAARMDEPFVVIFDEFTYVVRNDPSMTSILQRVWDHKLSKAGRLKLVLTGSMVSTIKSEILSARAPLYGRATAIQHLRPLPFGTLSEVFPKWPRDQRVAAYAVAGGVPAYLDILSRGATFEKALLDHVLTSGSIMTTDALLILSEQLKDPYVYSSVLSMIGAGFHDWDSISKMTGIEKTSLSQYMETLIALELVQPRKPIMAMLNARKTRYHLSDPFLRFYYRFVEPNASAISRGRLGQVKQALVGQLRSFIGLYVFEEICRDWVGLQADIGRLGFQADMGQIGSYWTSAKDAVVQIDVAAATMASKQALLGECKWGEAPVSKSVLTDFLERCKKVGFIDADWRVQHFMFARTGFTPATKDEAKKHGVRLVDLAELEDDLAAGI